MAFFRRRTGALSRTGEKSIPDGLWMKCKSCGQTLFKNEVEEKLNVCPSCGHHYRVGARRRVEMHFDPGTFEETHAGLAAADPLQFSVGEESYAARVARARQQAGISEALLTGFARIDGMRTAVGAMDSQFIMASMGAALGEKFCRLCKDAIRERVPVIVFAASGGARMQEGILALMQMAKTSGAVRELNEAGIPYIVVLTDPTSGGVYASFASLGDIILAEPRAYIGFAGARLIEGALKVKLPDGFQTSEYQFENGHIDQIVKREELRPYLSKLVRMLHPAPDVCPLPVKEKPQEDSEAALAEA
jgi:acetyl-CoA carboxylase carboxyl transferase beta subunit